jgi:hypothetical protein
MGARGKAPFAAGEMNAQNERNGGRGQESGRIYFIITHHVFDKLERPVDLHGA